MGLGLRCKVLRLCLGFCLSVRMHMRLSLQVLSLCLGLQALSVRGKTLSLGSSLQMCRLRYGLVALGLQVVCMSLRSRSSSLSQLPLNLLLHALQAQQLQPFLEDQAMCQ